MTKVRAVKTTRDGWIMKWRDDQGVDRQQKCVGRTRRACESERRKLELQFEQRTRELTWPEFWEHCQSNYLSEMSAKHFTKCKTMQTRMAEAAKVMGLDPLRCCDITPALMLAVESSLREIGNEPATVKSNMDTLWSMVTWGQDFDLIPPVTRPRRRRGKKAKKARKAKGRSLSGEEIERIEAAIPLVCKSFESPDGFVRAMNVMRLTGMRISEAWMFAWEPVNRGHYPVRLGTSTPAIAFSDDQKSGIEQEVPLTMEAAKWLAEAERSQIGPQLWVCRTSGKRGQHATNNRLGRVIADAGKRARVVVKRSIKSSGKEWIKFASSHDFRRTFATELLHRLDSPTHVQQMTRHASVDTLLDYYADASTPVLMQKLRTAGL